MATGTLLSPGFIGEEMDQVMVLSPGDWPCCRTRYSALWRKSCIGVPNSCAQPWELLVTGKLMAAAGIMDAQLIPAGRH